MIGAVVVGILAVAALVYIGSPLRKRDEVELPHGPSLETQAKEDKELALSAIVDLQEEAEVGKLSPEEHQRLRHGYEVEAIDALQRLDDLSVRSASDDPLEQEIAAMRARLACPTCGAARAPGGSCPRCDA